MKPACLIYTGGTFGMEYEHLQEPRGRLVPQKFSQLIPHFKGLRTINGSLKQKSKLLESSSHVLEYKKLVLHCIALKEVWDSSYVKSQDWLNLAQIINDAEVDYAGFVLIHGTDTMSYTASALSFMLQSLNKPIFVVGSHKPLVFENSDALPNLKLALDTLLSGDIKQNVWITYGDKISLGNCSTKMGGAMGFPTLKTNTNYHTINNLKIKFSTNINLSQGVQVIFLTPSFNNQDLEVMLHNKAIHSFVFMSYGMGNAPVDLQFINLIKAILDDRKIIANLSQTPAGSSVKGIYSSSLSAIDDRILDLSTMTIEAAVTKLMWAKASLEFNSIKYFMENDCVGELS